MGDKRIGQLENELRRRIGQFVGRGSRLSSKHYEVLQKIREMDRNSFLCGGAVRDLLLTNARNQIVPRDLDIVLGYRDVQEVADSFSNCKKRWNCYGGVSIEYADWTVDVWLLRETWGFAKGHVEGKGFSDFPRTTFLNVEAVAVQLFPKEGKKREIYTKGFFEAILTKTIEINLEENPNPASCIARSLNLARRFGFAIGPRLAGYIAYHAREIELERLMSTYRKRYGTSRLTIDDLSGCVKAIEGQIRTSRNKSIDLRNIWRPRNTQLLWSNILSPGS